ncbi:hypothetical protein [Absidia glauca]|uniref:O-fucosyltransferase family protein n=1 Tax=Absidia glauca TaxID=4829 RepID=A0A163K7A9_ABSGL|nr:hypothetical protein [Absidia glauca]
MIRLNKSSGLFIITSLVVLFFIHTHLQKRLQHDLSTQYDKDAGPLRHASPLDRPDEEKFLTYLPHSGLHNQRIALINSVILAKALNRTLIMPEVNLGTATYWRPSTKLPYRLDDCGDRFYQQSATTDDGEPWWSPHCFDYRNYLPMAVETIFDLAAVHELGVKTIQRRDMQLDYFERYWAIPRDERNRTLAYQVEDTSRYSYQILDGDSKMINKSAKFVEHYTLQQLGRRHEPFLIFNSLFGSDRLALPADSKWSQTRDWLRKEIGVRQPWVINSSLDVIARLGGPGSFISVHIRMGDGIFKKMMDETMERVRRQLIERQPTTNSSTIDNDNDDDDQLSTTVTYIRSLQAQSEERLTACLQLQQHSNQSPLHHRLGLIYMATDASSPHLTLPHLFEEFVCLFTLGDFKDVIDRTLALRPPLLDHRHQHHHQVSKDDPIPTTKGSIFLPLIDAEIASQGSFFVPTPKSTFSGYIKYRNKRFRHLYMHNTTSAL